MDWSTLHCGSITKKEIEQYVGEEEWQKVRLSMKGKTLGARYNILSTYLEQLNNSRPAQVRVTNYINALSRGGMIKPIRGGY